MDMENSEKPGMDRRSFIRRAAATGGITIFAAPAIQTVAASAARASNGAASPPPNDCFHSVGAGGGCKGACTSVGSGLGGPCEDICGPACPVGTEDRMCVSPDYCDPACYVSETAGEVQFIC
jgi:hypothetical protein